jgi:AraC-like DNA-binding protein
MYYFVMSNEAFKDAVVVSANIAQFGPDQRTDNRHVESRMLLWCRSGRGTATVNGQRFAFEPGRYLILPWAHRVIYCADHDDPFQVAGIHVIPRHDRNVELTLAVAHRINDPLAGVSWRSDIEIPSLKTVRQGTFDQADPLPHLAEYILSVFLRGTPTEWQARQLAAPLLQELILASEQSRAYAPNTPPELERMIQYVQTNLHAPLSLSDLVTFSDLSAATVGRMFRKHLHTTPVSWILEHKMELAGMLLRTRKLTVAEVGERVGIPDPYYFSKCFRKHTGQSPREYRTARHWI